MHITGRNIALTTWSWEDQEESCDSKRTVYVKV